MTDPRIDVVIPTRDRPQLLARAVRSAWSQDYDGDVHVHVVLDGPGEQPDLPTPPPGRSLTVARNRGTAGLAGARNDGLRRVTADLFATLDDDDEWHPRKLAAQVALLGTDDSLVGAGGGTCIVQHDSRTVRLPPLTRVRHADLVEDRIASLHPSTLLLRTAVVHEIGGWDEDVPGGYAEDYDFLLRLSTQGDIGMVPEVVTDVHWAGHSYFFSRWAQIAEALGYVLAKHPEIAQSARGYGRILGQIAFAQAASRDRGAAWRTIRRGLRVSPRQPRFLLAGLVASGIVSADRVQQMLHSRGRGV